MLTSVHLCVHHATKVRKLGLDHPEVRFAPGYNVLIGPNGSGKSTVLRAIATCEVCRVEKTHPEDVFKYVNTETLDARRGGTYTSREEMILGIRALFRSHGQGVMDRIRLQSHGGETIVLLDSPETGQDLEQSALIHQGLLKMAERYQVIVATNSLTFMRRAHLIDLGDGTLDRLVQSARAVIGEIGAS